MLGEDRRMTPAMADHLARLATWRAIPHAEQLARMTPWIGPPPDGDPRPRVGILSPCCNLGGADLWVADLMGAVEPARVRWSGTACRDDTGIPINPHVRGLWERHGPFGAGYAAISDLARRSDLLVIWGAFHTWGFAAEPLAGLVGTTPLLVASHGTLGGCLTDPGGRFPHLSAAACSRAALRGLPPGLQAETRVILNAIAPARVARTRSATETRRLLGVPEGAKVAGWLSRLTPDKRPGVYLDALAALPPEWVGVVAGSGYGEADARRHATAVLDPARLIWLGNRHDVGDLLASFECLCMPSTSEACSLSAGEAWLAGVPLISTPVGLLEEDRPDLARLLPNPPTGADLAGAILADQADPEGTAARVARARAFAATHLTMDRFGADWTEAILAACPTRPSVTTGIDPAVRDAVNACLDRGPVLPLSLQPAGCCGPGPEVSECRAGKGSIPGRVTLRDCLACKEAGP